MLGLCLLTLYPKHITTGRLVIFAKVYLIATQDSTSFESTTRGNPYAQAARQDGDL